jgi:hypothetical protein
MSLMAYSYAEGTLSSQNPAANILWKVNNSSHSESIKETISDVTYGNNMFIAVGYNVKEIYAEKYSAKHI